MFSLPTVRQKELTRKSKYKKQKYKNIIEEAIYEICSSGYQAMAHLSQIFREVIHQCATSSVRHHVVRHRIRSSPQIINRDT